MSLWQRFKQKHKAKSQQEHASIDDNLANKDKPINIEKSNSSPVNNKIKYIIAVASGKGGVGKSTVSSNLAYALQAQNKQVGILDADIYGPSQSLMMANSEQAQAEDGMIIPLEHNGIKFISMSAMSNKQSPVVVRSPIAVKAIHQFLNGVAWGDLDYLIIDLPPGTGDIQLSLAQKAHLSGVIIVTTPQDLAVQIAEKSLQMFQRVNVPLLGVVENMSGFTCQSCQQVTHIFNQGGGALLAQKYNIPLLTQLPLIPEIITENQTSQAHPKLKPLFKTAATSLDDFLQKMSVSQSCEPSSMKFDKMQATLNLAWSDGLSLSIGAFKLRSLCGCALCRDEITGEAILQESQIKPDIALLEVKPVGRYGLGCRFSDGHTTGIYRYEKLKLLGQSL